MNPALPMSQISMYNKYENSREMVSIKLLRKGRAG